MFSRTIAIFIAIVSLNSRICYGRAKVIVGSEPICSSRKIAVGSLGSALAGAKITVGFFFSAIKGYPGIALSLC